MKYFNGITDLEEAKLRYRKLAKKLHPDIGGTAIEFQQMKDEYKALIARLQQKHKLVNTPTDVSSENELLTELEKLAKILIRKQVPQNYLQQKMQTTESPIKKALYRNLVNILNGL